MHSKTIEILEQLDKAEWFSAVGARDTEDAVVLSSWNEAIKFCDTIECDNFRIEMGNQLSRSVAKINPERFKRWNGVVREIKPSVNALVERKIDSIVREHALPKVFHDDVHWDILKVCMETEYSDLVPLGFYTELASWYLKGHFPCGWDGEYPDGRLIVY